MPEETANTRSLRDAIDLLADHGVALFINASEGGTFHFEIEGRPVTEIEVIARAAVLDREDQGSPHRLKRLRKESDRGRRYTLLGRALRILALHGFRVLVIGRNDHCEFEIDEAPVREIDVIVRAAMIDPIILGDRDRNRGVEKHVA